MMFTAGQKEIYDQILMMCGPTYYCEPSYKTVNDISTVTGTRRALAICIAAINILDKFNAEPARRMHLQSQIKQYNKQLELEDTLDPYLKNIYWNYTTTNSLPAYSIKDMQQQQKEWQLAQISNNPIYKNPKKLNKVNRYLIAFITEASRGNVVSHQSVSEFQVRLICTVCNATFSYDEDSESDWAVSTARDFCHDHRHEQERLVIDIPVSPEGNRRKFRDE